jgi:hypothetical protein
MGREFEPFRGHLKIKALHEECEALVFCIRFAHNFWNYGKNAIIADINSFTIDALF